MDTAKFGSLLVIFGDIETLNDCVNFHLDLRL